MYDTWAMPQLPCKRPGRPELRMLPGRVLQRLTAQLIALRAIQTFSLALAGPPPASCGTSRPCMSRLIARRT